MCVSACVWCLGLEVPTVDVDALSEGDQQVAPTQQTLPSEVSCITSFLFWSNFSYVIGGLGV